MAERERADEAIRQSQGYLKTARDCLDAIEMLREALIEARSWLESSYDDTATVFAKIDAALAHDGGMREVSGAMRINSGGSRT